MKRWAAEAFTASVRLIDPQGRLRVPLGSFADPWELRKLSSSSAPQAAAGSCRVRSRRSCHSCTPCTLGRTWMAHTDGLLDSGNPLGRSSSSRCCTSASQQQQQPTTGDQVLCQFNSRAEYYATATVAVSKAWWRCQVAACKGI